MVRFRFLDAIFELRKALWSLAGFTFQFFNISTTMSETAEKTENNEKESQENGESTFCCIKFMLTQTIFAYEACSRMDLYITVLYQSIPFRDHWELGLRFGNICVVGIPRCLACIFMPITNKQRGHTRLRENGALQWIVINLWSPNRYRTSVKNFDCVQEII